MNNVKECHRVATSARWSLSTTMSELNKSNVALALLAVAIVAIGSIFLISYPLETMIVALFIGSVFVLDRK